MYYMGIDVGSIATKAVLIDSSSSIVAQHIEKTGAQMHGAIERAMNAVYQSCSCCQKDITACVSTGYGRKNVACADTVITEITAHARGARHLFPGVALIIDIGGQDTKVISLDGAGQIKDFVMNDKCAAGTGRFLEVMAGILDMPLADLGQRALMSTKKLSTTSTCTVFAESEVISLISRQEKPEDIAFAIHDSVVERIINLAEKVKIKGDIILSGGVSRNSAICRIIQERLDEKVFLPDEPQIIGALGAALSAASTSF
jgi:(R)-2-hydroxyacyl-CoA dehydratese activating ATPase